jgi:hypothetical protein
MFDCFFQVPEEVEYGEETKATVTFMNTTMTFKPVVTLKRCKQKTKMLLHNSIEILTI